MSEPSKQGSEEMKTVEITLPRAYWDQVRRLGAAMLLKVDFAEEKDLPEIVALALEAALGLPRKSPRQSIPFKM